MTFTTLTFLIFFALFFPLYWGMKGRVGQNILIVIASYIFYAWWDYRFAGLMLLTSLFDYGVGLGLNQTKNTGPRRALLAFSIVCNLGLLGFFKYFNFFAENFRAMAESVGWHVDPITLRIVLPVGISFYTFQTMSYTIDVYHRKMEATHHITEYLAYVSFFPQLVAGPIERATHLLPQFFKPRVFSYPVAVDGCRHILWGFFKKLAIADNLATIVEKAYADPAAMTGPQLILATVCFAFQIYCDFSAYSDIAIGLAKLCGFSLMRNFAYPYFSQSMAEFWRRWHISLSTWFRDYVYVPMGGSRVTAGRHVANVMVTFLLSGLWHGASWNFLIWGGINGLAILPSIFRSQKQALRAVDVPAGNGVVPSVPIVLRIGLTFALTCLAWVFFRARTLADALLIFQKMVADALTPAAYHSVGTLLQASSIGNKIVVPWMMLIVAEWLQRRHWHPLALDAWPRFVRWLIYTGLIWISLYWGSFGSGQFIYFQF